MVQPANVVCRGGSVRIESFLRQPLQVQQLEKLFAVTDTAENKKIRTVMLQHSCKKQY